MTTKHSTLHRSISLLLVVMLGNVYVLAGPGRTLFGRLATTGNNSISLNGREATSGATILSGAQLQTPATCAALVQLDSGSLDILPGTNLTLTFNEGNVAVNVAAGGAVLTTKKGVSGAVTFNGVTTRTDPSAESSTATAGSAPPQRNNLTGKQKGWIAASIIAGVILIAYLATRGDDESPSRP